jgi:poly(3-hydroxybutyrate) depolymerase
LPTWTRLLRILPALPLAVGACAGNPQASSQPTQSAAPSATSSAHTPYDGVWASNPLTRADVAATLARRGLSDAHLDEWYPDWDKIDYRVLEIEIGQGRWQLNENAEGVGLGVPWAGDIVSVDADTIVAQDDTLKCPVTYDLSRDGDVLSVRVADDACSDPEDLAIQATIYESSPFHLVQAADWIPPAASFEPSASSPAGSQASTSSTRQQVRPIGTVDGAPLGYVEYLPPNYGSQPSPLLVFLHGSGESGSGDELSLASLADAGIPSLTGHDQWPDERPFVVLAPQHNEDPSSFCLEADEIDAFLRFALTHYDIDPSRVYLTGLSCGAIGLWNYLGAHGDELVAAAVPIAGYGIGAVELAGCDLARVPIWAFHGSADENVPVRGDVYPLTTLQACTDPAPVDARLKVYQGAQHDVWTETYISTRYDIYGWLLSHHK